MPIFLNTAGILAEAEQFLYNAPEGDFWGDKLPRWKFAGVFNFTVTKQFGAALIIQFRTLRNYRDGDRSNTNHYFYQYRELDRENPLRLEFYRAAAVLTYKFR
jgi:hypothetical protein